jgi:hypothetical protein
MDKLKKSRYMFADVTLCQKHYMEKNFNVRSDYQNLKFANRRAREISERVSAGGWNAT